MNFDHEMLLQITLDVCGSMLGFSRIRVSDQPELTQHEECLEGSIRITGEWDVELRVVCRRGLALWMAAEMYDTITDDLTAENVRDALREVIAVIGVDVKEALGGQNWLSFPRVRENVTSFGADAPAEFRNFHGDVLTVHLVDATCGAVLA